MGSKLYVGNLSFNTTEADLKDAFGAAGTVESVELIQDKFSGKSRGFGFVTMATDQDAQNAITQFHGKEVDGRALTVNEARPREERPQGAGGGGGYRGGGGGGGGYRGGGGGRREERGGGGGGYGGGYGGGGGRERGDRGGGGGRY
jgi:RNA recognition motif-containing protein